MQLKRHCVLAGLIALKRKIQTIKVTQRFSRRAKKSSWTELNKESVRHLEKLGLMTDEGRKVLPDMCSNAFIIDEFIEKRLKEDEQFHEIP